MVRPVGPLVAVDIIYEGVDYREPVRPLSGGSACDVAGPPGPRSPHAGVWAPLGAQPTPNPTPSPAPLHASLSAALSARAGSVLEYTVTLTDVTAEPVVLDPCPYYVESLGGRVVGNTTPPPGFPSAKPWRGEPIYAGYAKEAYELNCADVQSIPAGGAATFAMRLRVPLDAAGPETLRWHLVVAGRDIETASAPLVIDPAP